MCFLGDRLFQVDTRECHEDECLEECNEKLEEPKWKNEESTEPIEPMEWEECPEIYDNSDECDSGEYIRKKSNWERYHTSELTEEVDPSDWNIYDFFHDTMTREIEEIVGEMMNWAFHDDSCSLCDDDRRESHDESRRYLSIHGA